MRKQNKTKAYIYKRGVVTLSEIMQDRCLIETGQRRHVLDLVEFRWICSLYILPSNRHLFARLDDSHNQTFPG